MGNKSEYHNLTVEERAEAVAMFVAGANQRDVAERFGVSQPSISHLFGKEEIKEIITSAQKELTIRCLKPAIENIHWLIQNYRKNKIDENGKTVPLLPREQLNHAWDAHKEVLKSTGITPYPTDSKLVQYIYQDNRQVFMSPVMSEALKKYGESLKLPDLIDEEK